MNCFLTPNQLDLMRFILNSTHLYLNLIVLKFFLNGCNINILTPPFSSSTSVHEVQFMCVVYLSFLLWNIWYDSFSLSKVRQRKYVQESIKSYFTTPKVLLDISFQSKHIVDFSSILGRRIIEEKGRNKFFLTKR